MDFDKFFVKSDLIPAIIQEKSTGEVLMLAYMNKESMKKTFETGYTWFWSRSRQELWNKGATSGHLQKVIEIFGDCDNDTLLVKVHPDGPTCHKGTDTCWGEENEKSPLLFLAELSDFIEKRHQEMPEGSYTTSLFRDGLNRMAQKVGEEALELVIEATNGTNDRLIYEGSDMLYHLIVLLTHKGLRIEDMAAELRERHCPGWKKH